MSHRMFARNTKGRDFIIGDMHGCLEEFNKLLEFVSFDKTKDRCFSVGDLVDRGKDSVGCLQLIYQDWFHAVRGNHEQMMIDVLLNGDDYYGWHVNGGNWAQFEDEDFLKQLAKKADELPYIITIDGICNIVHAELIGNADGDVSMQSDVENYNFNDTNETTMLWCRTLSQGYASMTTDKLLTVCGHTPMPMPSIYENHFNIDTGAVYKHSMTLLEVLDVDTFKIYRHDMVSGETIQSYDINQ